MLDVLKNIFARIDQLQRRLWFCVTVTVICVIACAGFFGTMIWTTYDLHQKRTLLAERLEGQNIEQRDPLAVRLYEAGEIVVDGQRFGDPLLQQRAADFFDSRGDIINLPALVERLIFEHKPAWAPEFLIENPGSTTILAVITLGVMLLIIWLHTTLTFLLTAAATLLLAGLFWLVGLGAWMTSIIGIGLLTFMYVVFTRMLLVLLSGRSQPVAVANTVVREASRQGVSLFFIVALLVLLPLLPMALDPSEALRYRIQTFISRSLNLTYVMAACMTLFLACATVAFEIRDRQIWQLVTKPMSRFQYLMGKWLGIAAINLVLLLICGVSIFFFIQSMRVLPVAPGLQGMMDRLAVRDEVLVARETVRTVERRLSEEELRAAVDQRIARDPMLADQPDGSASPTMRARISRQVQDEYSRSQRSIPPVLPGRSLDDGSDAPNRRTYVFEGLAPARHQHATLTLRYRFHIGGDDTHQTYPVEFDFGGGMRTREVFVPRMYHVLPVPPDVIRNDGSVHLTIINPIQVQRTEFTIEEAQLTPVISRSINFEHENLEILYRVGSFEANFFRAVAVMWIKLSFLGLLGIVCATFLSFPVACLLGFTVFLVWSIGPFLAEALEAFYPPRFASIDWTNLNMVFMFFYYGTIRLIALFLVFISGQMGEFNPTQALVEGRLISWVDLTVGFLRLIVVWCGLLLLLGFSIFRKRELAIYSGHG